MNTNKTVYLLKEVASDSLQSVGRNVGVALTEEDAKTWIEENNNYMITRRHYKLPVIGRSDGEQ